MINVMYKLCKFLLLPLLVVFTYWWAAPTIILSQQVEHTLATRTIEEQRIIDVYKTTRGAIVFITTLTLTVDPFDVFLELKPREGTGSGFIVDAARGIVLTNLHVIQDAQKIEIMLENGENYKARLLGFDQEYDIAVLQIVEPPDNLVALKFGDSSKIEVGQRASEILLG